MNILIFRVFVKNVRFTSSQVHKLVFTKWLERALQGEDPTLYKEEGPQERDHEAEGDGYDYEDDDFFDYEETIEEDEKVS